VLRIVLYVIVSPGNLSSARLEQLLPPSIYRSPRPRPPCARTGLWSDLVPSPRPLPVCRSVRLPIYRPFGRGVAHRRRLGARGGDEHRGGDARGCPVRCRHLTKVQGRVRVKLGLGIGLGLG